MRFPSVWRLSMVLALTAMLTQPFATTYAQPFVLQGPGVNINDFRVTVFASGLDFPLGMAQLTDGSILAAVHQGGSYFTASGKLIRLTDANHNGIADAPGTMLYGGLPNLTAVRVAGNLVIATGQAKPFFVFRTGAQPSDPLTLVGQMGIAYPLNPGHPHSALAVRKTARFTNRYDLLFQLGCEYNFATTTNSLALTNNSIPGATGLLAGDALHMITLIDNTTNVTATNLV